MYAFLKEISSVENKKKKSETVEGCGHETENLLEW